MRMITPNKKTKKGFSLVEMLVVIAIIAILVSIIIPVVHHNTVKAAAATNAANLRAIEGKLKIMRLDTPEDFKNYLDMFKDGTLSQLKNDLGTVFDFLFGTGWTEAQLSENFGKKTADNGVLTLEETNVQITGVPTAKKLKVRGTKKFDTVNIEEGTQMSVYITPDTIRAVYIGEDGSVYGVEHFADIAENGKLTNTQIGQTGGSQESGFICDTWGHVIGPDGKCQRTGCTFDSGYHTCIDVKKVIREPFTGAVIYTTDGQDDKCDICGIDMNHACEDNEPKDHRCDAGCGAILSDCDEKQPVDKHNHCCSVCGGNQMPHQYVNGYCMECGRPEHLMPEDCYDELDPGHDCDYPGCGNSNASDCADTNPKDHVCDHQCGNETIGTHQMTHAGNFQHNCTYCSSDKVNCTISTTTTHHKCNECDLNEKHTFDSSTLTCSCGYTCSNHVDNEGGMLGGGNGICDYCGYNMSGTSGGSCVTPDTLVTMADGSKKRVDEITYDDLLLVWDFFEGKYTAVPASVIVFHGNADYVVTELIFEDGTSVKTIGAHDFFSVEANEFVSIDSKNVASFVGNHFIKADGDSYTAVELVDYDVRTEYTGSYSLLSAKHNNFIVEDMFSLTPLLLVDTPNFFEYFEVGEGMKYDEAKMKADIEKYGLYTYEDFKDYLTYEQYVALNAPYYKVIVGRGEVTFEDLLTAISAYVE